MALRPVVDADVPVLFEHQRDPDAQRMAASTGRDAEAFAAHWQRIRSDDSGCVRVIVSGETVAGYIVAFARPDGRAIGYWLGREHWGRGIATAALRLFLEEERARPLIAHVARHNVASLRVLQKAGFCQVREETGGDGVAEVVLELRA